MQLTLFFDSPYWVGVLEVEQDGLLYAARHIFGAEPSAEDVYAFVLHNLAALQARMAQGVPVEAGTQKHINPKRVQREIRRELAREGVSSKAHEAMRLQLEQGKQARRTQSREAREAEQARKRAIAREKARQKHRGH
ncbi:MAG TPA: YjdF family protein [Aggregatilinea sp.]|uniref:YjdF family protein n=1 Tax=Aggregatilinea sp. TaxID=2806333 RepID=UPI002B9668C1|nr:YjdF family protein [Aggregatilinea sp.]HML24501.1 YjdF family protein [Aggregatilinea sp.]